MLLVQLGFIIEIVESLKYFTKEKKVGTIDASPNQVNRLNSQRPQLQTVKMKMINLLKMIIYKKISKICAGTVDIRFVLES